MKPGKLDELKCTIKAIKNPIHIIILTETWIKSDTELERVQISGYTHYSNYRSDMRGGGVSILVHNNLKHSEMMSINTHGNHYQWIRLDEYAIDIGAIYRKPENLHLQSFLDTYSEQLYKSSRAIIFGDFNINILSDDRTTTSYKQIIEENGYKILNRIDGNYATRVTTTTNTIIDHVCTNLTENSFHLALVESAMSDHKQIYLELKKHQPNRVQKIKYESINYETLYKMVQTIDLNGDLEYLELENKLISCIKLSKESKVKIQNCPRQDWINKEIISGINKRNTLFHELKKNPADANIKENFIKERNRVTERIQSTKNGYYQKSFNDCQRSPRKMWRLINSLARNKIEEVRIPSKLLTDSATITDPKEICECFNEYFSSIGATLASKFSSNPKSNYTSSTSRAQSSLTEFTHATVQEVSAIINNLDANTSAGLDGISVKSVKCIKDLIIDKLTDCFNHCLIFGYFPDSLKLAKVTPIHKSATKTDPGNYRPISVLPILSKILETLLYSRLGSYLASINFFYDKQYGFRPQSNTLTATIDLVTKIKVSIDQKNIVLGVFIDLKKAFDTISHPILLEKLKEAGLGGTVLKMFQSYLENRKQIVKIGEYQSSLRNVTFGVPQGSILGPLLFLIYINNLSQIGLKGDATLYADDTSLFYYGNSLNDIISDAQSDLNLLSKWFKHNMLTVNVSKTNYIIFSPKNKKLSNHPPLIIDNYPINNTDQEKYLGLILDKKLTWQPHIEKIRAKLTALTGSLKSIVRCLPKRVRYTIYNTLVKPHIEYLTELWGTAPPTTLTTLQRAQNKLIKVLFHFNYLTPTTKIYKETKILNIDHAYIYHTCILIRKILLKDLHIQISFTRKKQIQKMKLRNANNLVLRPPRTNYGKKCILYEGANLYNKLPSDIKDAKSLSTFKRLLKQHLLTRL